VLLHVALFFTEPLPLSLITFSVACHIIYLQNFTTTWPLISLSSPIFILSCVAVVADHFMWFTHFARQAQKARQWARSRFASGGSEGIINHTFWETTSFFATCVWLIPLYLFLSLSANDNALPFSTSAPGRLRFAIFTIS
jgi:synaptojanin